MYSYQETFEWWSSNTKQAAARAIIIIENHQSFYHSLTHHHPQQRAHSAHSYNAVKAGTWSRDGRWQRGSVRRGTPVSCSHRVKSWRLQSHRKGLLWISTPFRPWGNNGSPPSLERELSSSFNHSRDSKPAKASSLEHKLSEMFTRSLGVMSHLKNRNVLLWNLAAKCSHSFLFLSWTKPRLVKTGRKRICHSAWVITKNPHHCRQQDASTFQTRKHLKVATKI